MIYKNYVEKISNRFQSRFDEIDPMWNFDQGNEFEIELATLIDELLPDKYGVCRGFVTPKSGTPKGDDIVIYDKLNVPLLRPPNNFRFTRKEYVPLEATYAYIEAKNTIELKNKSKSTYIGKALKQVSDIKKLKRKSRKLEDVIDGFNLKNIKATKPVGSPQILNPMFTVLFCRGVRINGKLEKNIDEIKKHLPEDTGKYGPDLIILGPNIGITPHFIDTDKEGITHSISYETPFCIEDRHRMLVYEMPKTAYGFGLSSLLYAFCYLSC